MFAPPGTIHVRVVLTTTQQIPNAGESGTRLEPGGIFLEDPKGRTPPNGGKRVVRSCLPALAPRCAPTIVRAPPPTTMAAATVNLQSVQNYTAF